MAFQSFKTVLGQTFVMCEAWVVFFFIHTHIVFFRSIFFQGSLSVYNRPKVGKNLVQRASNRNVAHLILPNNFSPEEIKSDFSLASWVVTLNFLVVEEKSPEGSLTFYLPNYLVILNSLSRQFKNRA